MYTLLYVSLYVQMYIFIKVYNTNCRSYNSVINIDKSLKIVFFLDIQDVMLNFCQTALNGLYLTFFGSKCPKNASLLNMCMFLWRANLQTLPSTVYHFEYKIIIGLIYVYALFKRFYWALTWVLGAPYHPLSSFSLFNFCGREQNI